jgi:hypothetical protein
MSSILCCYQSKHKTPYKISVDVSLGEWAGQFIGPPRPIQLLAEVSFNNILILLVKGQDAADYRKKTLYINRLGFLFSCRAEIKNSRNILGVGNWNLYTVLIFMSKPLKFQSPVQVFGFLLRRFFWDTQCACIYMYITCNM